jgi:TIR domain
MAARSFLSYARGDDEPFVRRLYEDLTAKGFEVWFDRVSPSRLLTFYQEIRDAVAARDRLLLVGSPKAVYSDYVTQEWRFAYSEAAKCVNPIVRLDGTDGVAKPVDGYDLIPEDLRSPCGGFPPRRGVPNPSGESGAPTARAYAASGQAGGGARTPAALPRAAGSPQAVT